MNIIALIKLLRPKQWLKNCFVFIPLIFSGTAWDSILLFNAAAAFILFCLAASAVYVLNDIHDVELDRAHSIKAMERQIASGAVSIKTAWIILAVLYFLILLQLWLFSEVFKIILIYVLLNLVYTFFLKQQPVIDMFIISLGFILRVVAGSVAIDIPIAPWMLITTLSLSIYLTAIKRRQELINYPIAKNNKLNKKITRQVLEKYTVIVLGRYAEMAGTSTFIFYSMYVLLIKPILLVTVPLVMFGLFRYWYIVEEQNTGESPTDLLLTDKQLLLTVILWIASCVFLLNY